MRISYSLLSTMANDGCRNAKYCLAKWDMEISSPTIAPEEKVECIVRDSGELTLVVSKKTLLGMPAVSVEPTTQEIVVEVGEPEPALPDQPTLPGNGRRGTPMRPTFRKDTWQWVDKEKLLARAKSVKLPQVKEASPKKDLPFSTTYSFVAEGDDYI